VLFEAEPRERQAVPPAVAWVTTQILRKVILQGTGIAANIGRPAAGKTGTAQQWRDAWFAGYVPQLSAAVWVGFPQGAISMVPPTTRTRVTGGSFPAQIWQAFMTRATKGMPVRNFRKPDATEVTVAIDRSRGCVADAGADPASVEMVTFVAGTEPKRCSAQPVAASAPTAPGLPAVVGMPLQDAVQVLVGKGYTTSNESEYHPGYPRGTVIRQYPGAGSDVPRGARVHLIVATQEKPYVVVPKVTGLTEREAKAKLRAAGFAVAIRHASKRRPGEPTGVVLSQDPAAGAERPSGATVTIILNPPPSPSPSPSPS